LKMGFDELLATSLAFARAWHLGAAAAPPYADAGEKNGAHTTGVADGSGLRPPDSRERWR
jgi:hypothetical protein